LLFSWLETSLREIFNDAGVEKLEALCCSDRCRSADRAGAIDANSGKLSHINTDPDPIRMLYNFVVKAIASTKISNSGEKWGIDPNDTEADFLIHKCLLSDAARRYRNNPEVETYRSQPSYSQLTMISPDINLTKKLFTNSRHTVAPDARPLLKVHKENEIEKRRHDEAKKLKSLAKQYKLINTQEPDRSEAKRASRIIKASAGMGESPPSPGFSRYSSKGEEKDQVEDSKHAQSISQPVSITKKGVKLNRFKQVYNVVKMFSLCLGPGGLHNLSNGPEKDANEQDKSVANNISPAAAASRRGSRTLFPNVLVKKSVNQSRRGSHVSNNGEVLKLAATEVVSAPVEPSLAVQKEHSIRQSMSVHKDLPSLDIPQTTRRHSETTQKGANSPSAKTAYTRTYMKIQPQSMHWIDKSTLIPLTPNDRIEELRMKYKDNSAQRSIRKKSSASGETVLFGNQTSRLTGKTQDPYSMKSSFTFKHPYMDLLLTKR